MTDPWRTSPETKIPGWLDSSQNGSRLSAQPFGQCPLLSLRGRSGPFISLYVQPFKRHAVAHQKVADLVRLRRIARSHNSQTFDWSSRSYLPICKQIIQRRIEILLGRPTRLHQVIVDL